MSQSYTPTQMQPETMQPHALQQLQAENDALKKCLAAQKAVVASLERRVGRSLDTLDSHLQSLTGSHPESPTWYRHLHSMQGEVNSLCDLISDTMLLQKLEAGKIDVNVKPLALEPLITTASRHLLDPKDGSAVRLLYEIDASLPLALVDQELTEAVLTDLLARGLKYSDAGSPVTLGAEHRSHYVELRITAQRFAPAGNRDFATEIALCCRRVEVQQGTVTCHQRGDGSQTVTIALNIASHSNS